MYVYMYICIYACMYVCIYVCMYICMNVLYVCLIVAHRIIHLHSGFSTFIAGRRDLCYDSHLTTNLPIK
jgi:hypothetical protein